MWNPDKSQRVRRGACTVQVEAAGDHPERVFRLDVSVTMPKWARVIDWTVRDDAMLLLGIYW